MESDPWPQMPSAASRRDLNASNQSTQSQSTRQFRRRPFAGRPAGRLWRRLNRAPLAGQLPPLDLKTGALKHFVRACERLTMHVCVDNQAPVARALGPVYPPDRLRAPPSTPGTRMTFPCRAASTACPKAWYAYEPTEQLPLRLV